MGFFFYDFDFDFDFDFVFDFVFDPTRPILYFDLYFWIFNSGLNLSLVKF